MHGTRMKLTFQVKNVLGTVIELLLKLIVYKYVRFYVNFKIDILCN